MSQKNRNSRLLLSEEVKKLYCWQDFVEWLTEMRDPDTCDAARLCICEGLSALKIPHRMNESCDYYNSLIRNHFIKTKKILPFEKMEEKLLVLLFDSWRQEENKKLREEITYRQPEETWTIPGLRVGFTSTYDYYKESFIYYCNDIERMGASTYESYGLWFDDEAKVVEKLANLLGDEAVNCYEEIHFFVQNMYSVNGLLPDGRKQKVCGGESAVSRTSLAWLSSVYEIAEVTCFGRENHRSLPETMARLDSRELESAGFKEINFDNCLDVYLAFSAYNHMKTISKHKRVWPGRKIHNQT